MHNIKIVRTFAIEIKTQAKRNRQIDKHKKQLRKAVPTQSERLAPYTSKKVQRCKGVGLPRPRGSVKYQRESRPHWTVTGETAHPQTRKRRNSLSK